MSWRENNWRTENCVTVKEPFVGRLENGKIYDLRTLDGFSYRYTEQFFEEFALCEATVNILNTFGDQYNTLHVSNSQLMFRPNYRKYKMFIYGIVCCKSMVLSA